MDGTGADQAQAPPVGAPPVATVAAPGGVTTPELPVPPPLAPAPRLDVSAVPPQGGHTARRCPLRVQYGWFPPEGAEPKEQADVERLRAEAAAAFDLDVRAEVRALHADAVVVDLDRAVRLQAAETLLAMGRGAPVVVGGRLPTDVIGRRTGRPELLVRGDRRPDGTWSYHPVLVRNHRTLDGRPPKDPAQGALVSPLAAPWFAGTEPEAHRSIRTHQGDVMALAHLHRMLEATPHAPALAAGGVVGTEREVVWHRLDVAMTQYRWDRNRPTSETILARYDLEHSFRLDVLAAAAGGRPMVGPVAVGECASCPWRHHCGPRIEADDSTSLLPGFGYRQWYNLARAGITTRAQVADLDLRTALVCDAVGGLTGTDGPLDPDELDLAELVRSAASVDAATPVAEVATLVAEVVAGVATDADAGADADIDLDRLLGILAQHDITTAGDLLALDPAVVALSDQPIRRLAEAVHGARAQAIGRPLLRHGVTELVVPSADVEVDIDMESSLDGTPYLWGAWVDGRYHAVTSWEPLGVAQEAQVFAEFWAWLAALRQDAVARRWTVATYCWFKGAESGALRRGAAAAAEVLGHVDAPAEVEALLAGDQFVDLYEVFTSQLLTGGSAGLKVVAALAGFTWRDDDPSGADSMAWHAQAVGDPDPGRRTEARRRLLAYNEDDVRGTAAVRAWLRTDLRARSAPVPAWAP